MKIVPHTIFHYIRADEVAECWNNVAPELYATLWNTIVPLQPSIPNIEDSGPADHVGHACLAQYWDKLSRKDQHILNTLAASNAL